MTILTALKDVEITREELWKTAQDMASEFDKAGADILNRYPIGNVGDKIALYHDLVKLALLGDIRELLRGLDEKLTLLHSKVLAALEEEEKEPRDE